METITTTPENAPRHPKFVRWALMLGIVIILNIFFNVVIALAYPAPVYENYCPQASATPTDSTACVEQGGIWNRYDGKSDRPYAPSMDGFCDLYAKCQKPFQAALEAHALYAFVIMIVFGLVALIAGFLPTGSSIVSSGLSYGGVIAFIIASIQYWGTAGNWIRLAISAVGLLALLSIGWKRFRD